MPIIDATNNEQEKNYRKLLNKWEKEMRETGKPICTTCARLDINNAERNLKGKEHYMEGFSEPSICRSMIKEHDAPAETPVPYYLIEYTCPNGHGLSIYFPETKWNELQSNKTTEVEEVSNKEKEAKAKELFD